MNRRWVLAWLVEAELAGSQLEEEVVGLICRWVVKTAAVIGRRLH